METQTPSPTQAGAVLTCTQCGGELHPDQGQIFLNCPYCSAAVYLDKSQVVFHWYLAPTLDQPKAQASLARWMAGSQTVKDLDKKARIHGVSFTYFPVWYFRQKEAGKRETILLEPAAATSVSELRQLTIPAGDLRTYTSDLDAQAEAPTVPLDTALGWIKQRRAQLPSGAGMAETALVHIPVYRFQYGFAGSTYTALVEAGTGRVLANLFPAKAEAPYLVAGGITALVFLCLALFPIIGVFIDEEAGALVGLAACTGLGLIAAPILFALAMWVAAKV